MPLHPDFKAATWRGTTASDGEIVGISFDLEDGSIVRLKLDARNAHHAAGTLLENLCRGHVSTLIQSDSSSGSPSREGSPQEGQSE